MEKSIKKELIEAKYWTEKLLKELDDTLKNYSDSLDTVTKKKLIKTRNSVADLLRRLNNLLALFPEEVKR
jgi:hypothetical protein